MQNMFSEMKLFQVKIEAQEDFEALAVEMAARQAECAGCISIKYMKRLYTIDKVEPGEPPRQLSKLVKCVKYVSYWEFDSKESYGQGIKWYFDNYEKKLRKLMIAPFDIYCGEAL